MIPQIERVTCAGQYTPFSGGLSNLDDDPYYWKSSVARLNIPQILIFLVEGRHFRDSRD